MNCYNCGCNITPKNKTKEHIPAQAYFAGYGSEYKVNRITVPACRKCNEKYSKFDSEIRDAIGVSNNQNQSQMELTRKSAKSILRNIRGKENRLQFNELGEVTAVDFDYKYFKKLAIKDFKGLFFHKYGTPFPKDWIPEIIADFDRVDEKLANASARISAFLHKETEWSSSGHEDIFRYKYKAMMKDENNKMYEGENIVDAIYFTSIQRYHNKIGFVVIATSKHFLKTKKKKARKRRKKRNNKRQKEKLILSKSIREQKKKYLKTRALKILRNKIKRRNKAKK